MKDKKKFIPVMLMPFHPDQSIDYPALDRLIDFYLDSGAGGLFANCLSSEMYFLSKEEMMHSVQHIVDRVDGRVPVVATGSFGSTVEEQAAAVRAIYATGVSAVILISGLLAAESASEAEFRDNVFQLLELTPNIPVGFYECPIPYKRVISAQLLGELVNTGRVTYHKDTCLDISLVKRKLEATREEGSFGLYDAYMVHAVDSLRAGSAGLSCIQGNYFPELVVWLCAHFDDTEAAEYVGEVQDFFRRNMDVMHDTYPASAKYVLQKRGLDMGSTCRNGSVVPDGTVAAALDRLLEDAENLLAKLAVHSA
ncbi:dihydrodipicolinate synthase family protein [Sphingobacterium suaedae]|uniref:Dihydrodipicolinate synthase family protein n=1 Tax=Sphingobacterium suaedae TaxID=1686402 RepID=A0ABW5KL48_9SPHI